AAAVTRARTDVRTVATGPSGPAGTITPAPGSTATSGPPGPATAGGTRSAGGGPLPAPTPAPGGGTTIGVTRDSVTLGIFYPKTGFYTGIFRNVPVVTQAALDEAGPINGRRLVVKY